MPSEPLITVALTDKTRIGTIVVAYTSKYSRMWSWDVSDLQILGFQDVKARVRISDCSADGRYISYEAETRGLKYFAISKPPYFRALYITNVGRGWTDDVLFGSDNKVHIYRYPQALHCRSVPEKTQPGCPFKMVDHRKAGAPTWIIRDRRFVEFKEEATRARGGHGWVGRDSRGREYRVDGLVLKVDSEPLIDLIQPEFEEVVPPDWAKVW